MALSVHSMMAAALLALCGTATAEPPSSSLVDLELVIAVDVSRSMDAEEFALQRDGYVAAIRHSEFVNAILSGAERRIALTYVEWSGPDYQVVRVPWRVVDGPEAAAAFADDLAAQPLTTSRGTSISGAILYGVSALETNKYKGIRRVIDVSGDGPNNYGRPVTTARDFAVAHDVVINGLPVLVRPSPIYPAMDRYYADCVIGGLGAFLLPVRSRDEFSLAIRRKLVLEVAGGPAIEARPVPVALRDPVDCLVGERTRERYAEPFLPGL
ncbi:MAG: DUF1194 domain-containing protein [Bauldia sp.]|nr:DUF1194 domain-containing protein [Bauldia sp.]